MKIKEQSLFPEYALSSLNLRNDKFIITERILEKGNFEQIKKIIKLYGKSWIKKFVTKYGVKKLSAKSLNFYLTIFNIKNKDAILKEKRKNILWEF
ncbi:MAG: hypothetical protein J7M11_06240 [Elusimicrobia bacterium]|nr:hypothetical protein [Elusimicrobiota bacterium]